MGGPFVWADRSPAGARDYSGTTTGVAPAGTVSVAM